MRYKIKQRKPDTSQDEPCYSTAIEIPGETYPIVGYGFTQRDADDNVIRQLLEIKTNKPLNRIKV
jgi:hypothetical protein